MSDSSLLSAKQVRAGRALLAWSQQDLAKKAGIAASTLADFERGQRKPVPNNAQAIRAALENAGITFPAGGAVAGIFLPPLGPTTKSGNPIRWTTQNDIAQWAERRGGQSGLPELLSKLIKASGCSSVHFPSDEAVQHPGWDGLSIAIEKTLYVPKGTAGWEIGTQRDKILGKANDDYLKRTDDPEHLVRNVSTFIFVTPRPWSKKEQWADAKRNENVWADVRAYDGSDLVHWIETYPAVGHWLASHLGKRPAGTLQLEEVWQEWSLATQWPLSTDLILSDRDESAVEILTWLRSSASQRDFQGETAEEVCALLYAAITQLPESVSEHYLARCLVATDAEEARKLADSASPMIIVLIDPLPGLAQVITRKGHHVLSAYGSGSPVSNARRLQRPSREGIREALSNIGVPLKDAERFARESSRSLAILRRLMAGETGSAPMWARTPPPRGLIAGMLAGGWDEKSDTDQSVLSRLAGDSYDDLIRDLPRYAGDLDSPLRKVGTAWKIASPQDAWLLLASHVSSNDLSNFEAVAIEVLTSADPRYAMKPEERWLAAVKDVKPEYSEVLRRGVGETLIMLALFGSRAHADPQAEHRAARIVEKVLNGADGQRWWSLSTEFQLLAEAAPRQFLRELERSLDDDEPAIYALFGSDGHGIFDAEHLSDLLWALEALAWSQDYIAPVAHILARLDAADPGGRYSNRPGSSLRDIFLLWEPQTNTPLSQRLKVLDRLRNSHPEQAWKLMNSILPSGHDSVSPSGRTRWRDFDATERETISYPLIRQGAREITRRLLEDVGTDVGRWEQLLGRLSDIPEEDLQGLLDQLRHCEQNLTDEADRTSLWNRLRTVMNNHREFPDAEWSLEEDKIVELEEVYNLLAPHDPIQKLGWLFNNGVSLVRPMSDWEKNEQLLAELRTTESAMLLRDHGVDAVFKLAHYAVNAMALGWAVAQGDQAQEQLTSLIERGLRSDDLKHQQMAQGAIGAKAQPQDQWLESLVKIAVENNWGYKTVVQILHSLRPCSWTWSLAAQAGGEVDSEYWRTVHALAIDSTEDEVGLVVAKLLSAGRAHDAIQFVSGRKRFAQLPTGDLIQMLRAAATQPYPANDDRNAGVMFQYYLEQMLSYLDAASDVDESEMLGIEVAYLPILEHSKRPPKIIPKAMARSPELFVQIICAIFKPSPESGIDEDPIEEPARTRHAATQAFNILRIWDVIPGTGSDGKIAQRALDQWVKEARKLAKARGRALIADQKIGEVLAHSPVGDDGLWPALEIRELIETVRSEHLEIGFAIGLRNLRGVTTRLFREGGNQERELAAKFKAYATATAFDWHRTSAILSVIADDYETEAKQHDDSADRLDW